MENNYYQKVSTIGGSGKYSFRGRSVGNCSVQVQHMPEDNYTIRIVIQNCSENLFPTIKLSDEYAQLLWLSLNAMAKDLNWNFRDIGDPVFDRTDTK